MRVSAPEGSILRYIRVLIPSRSTVGGVAQSNKDAAYIPVTNIERVEVLRGPSSAIYGKDSIGGIINIVLKEPDNEWSGSVGAEYGSRKYI